jgi:hypothetical protein
MGVVSGGVQMRNGVMGDSEMGRRHAPFEAVAGKDHLPRPPGSARSAPATAEDQVSQDVASKLHGIVSTKPGCRIVPVESGVGRGSEVGRVPEGTEVNCRLGVPTGVAHGQERVASG